MVTVSEILEQNLRLVTAKNLEAAVAAFAPDGVLIDPHYPDPRMQGRDQIRGGLEWAFAGMRTFGFSPTAVLANPAGSMAIAEVDSHHVMQNGRELKFRQVFVAEVQEGLITRWQAYEPYGPSGIAGAFLGISKMQHRIKRRRANRSSARTSH
jgi:ketosteroid isomerase-like protein